VPNRSDYGTPGPAGAVSAVPSRVDTRRASCAVFRMAAIPQGPVGDSATLWPGMPLDGGCFVKEIRLLGDSNRDSVRPA
jgi:hypothetical protein